jgi:cell division protein FtsN
MDFNRIRILTIFFFCTLLFPSSIQASSRGIAVISDLSHQSGKLGAYRALIIGINDYIDPKIPDLETAVSDAKAMAGLLRERYGFQVELLLDRKATREAIYRALRSLVSSTKPDESVLIYYAGHGDLDHLSDDGWWIPADAEGGNPVTYLDNFLVQKHMRSMKARHVLLVSDSCYSGTLFGQARAMPQVIDDKYYLNLYNEKSRWGMTSGNKTPVSDQGSGGHSVFAYQLLKELRKNEKPYISTQEIYTRIAPIVGNNSEQIPTCRPIRNTGDQGGEFVFVVSSSSVFEKPILLKPEAVIMPGQTETALDDILKASEKKRKAVESWNQWQQSREHEYQQVKKIDGDSYLSSEQKAAAWQRFLAAVSQDNPYSPQDDEMRSYSRSRLNHWKSLQPAGSGPEAETVYKITIQVASIRDLKIADRMVARLKDKGYPAYRTVVEVPGKDTWYRVRIGSFERKADAQKTLKRLEKDNINAILLQPAATKPEIPAGFGGSQAQEAGRDGRFIAYDNGTVLDTSTGLMWAAKDNGADINWYDAKRYCENYRGGGYTDWRMPTQDELKGLYDTSKSYQVKMRRYNYVYLTKLIQLSSCCSWASNMRGSKAVHLNFTPGNPYWLDYSLSEFERILPVRGGN